MSLRAPASSLSQERMLKVSKAWADSADTIKSVITATCPAPFQAILTTVVDILSFFARNYCDLVANREDAEKLARACESVGTSICQLVARLPEFASDPSVNRLHQLLIEAYHYAISTLTPPPRRKKQWIVTLKSVAHVKDIREKLNAYKDDIREQLAVCHFVTSVSVRVAVADIPSDVRDVWREGELAMAESYRRIVQEELARLEAMQQQVQILRPQAASPASPIVDRKADKLNDIVVAARFRKMAIQQDIELGNMTLEQADANKIYQTVDKLCQEATEVAEKLKRPLTFEDWMIDSDSVVYDPDDANSLIGEGASGAVYCGRMDNQNVAVKVFNIKGITSRQIETAIKKEVEAWRQISDHKNIVSLLGVSTKVKYFVVSELCPNGTSRDYLSLLRDEEKRWQVELVNVLSDAAEGLQFMHQHRLVHRDVKGTNIFIREDGSAALGDFGLSRVVGSISTTSASFQRFTPNWASPEQLTTNDARTLTIKTDTWSFGMTVLELLTDKVPFFDSMDVQKAITSGDIGPHLPSVVPGELEFLLALVMDCCKKNLTDRPTDDVILDRLSSGMPIRKLLNDSPRLVKFLAIRSDALFLLRALELVVLQRDPLTPASMAALLGTQRDKIDGVLGALGTALATDNHGRVQLRDPGLADYLSDPRRCTDPRFYVDKTEANLRIAALCLQLLSRELHPNMCEFQNITEASRRMEDMSSSAREELSSRIPAHVVYAARYWVAHVCGSGRTVDSETAAAVVREAAWPYVRQHIESFATTAMVFWIEVLAAAGALDTLRTAPSGLAAVLPHSNVALALFSEAATLLEWFPELVSDSPACVYITVMPRLPKGNAILKLFANSAVLPFPIAVAQTPPFESVSLFRTLVEHSEYVPSVAFGKVGVLSVAISSDGHTVASGSTDKTIKLWEAATGRLLCVLKGHANSVTSVAFNSNGRIVVSGSKDSTIKLWDAVTGRLLRTLKGAGLLNTQKGHSGSVNSVAFSNDSRTVASGSEDKTIKLWDAASGRLLRTLDGNSEVVQSVAFSNDGGTVASGSRNCTIKLWEAATGQLLCTLEGHTRWVNSVTFSSDDRTLVSGSDDKTIKLWEVATRRLLRTLTGHSDWVDSVVFSGDGHTLASGSKDCTIKLWEAATGRLLQTLAAHSGEVYSVAFSRDGCTLVSGSGDQTAKLWRAAS